MVSSRIHSIYKKEFHDLPIQDMQVSVLINNRKYLSEEVSNMRGQYDCRRPGKLQAYEQEIQELRTQGMTYSQITEIIRAKGYDGSVAALRVFMQKEREHQKQAAAEKLNITEVNSFLIGIEKGLSAVKNAIMYPYNNGLAEGSVTLQNHHIYLPFVKFN